MTAARTVTLPGAPAGGPGLLTHNLLKSLQILSTLNLQSLRACVQQQITTH